MLHPTKSNSIYQFNSTCPSIVICSPSKCGVLAGVARLTSPTSLVSGVDRKRTPNSPTEPANRDLGKHSTEEALIEKIIDS